jgi:hypothetical protein
MKRSTLLTVAAVLAFAALLLYSTLSGSKTECEVCVSFNGRDNCATARGATETEAERSAQSTACGTIASGMAESINCGSVVPTRRRCKTA